jgi:hypothetical protein
MTASSYWPGQPIPRSGVYTAVHTNNHTGAHDLTILRSGKFPACNECGSRVYFTLAKPGQNIANNEHFMRREETSRRGQTAIVEDRIDQPAGAQSICSG